MGELHLRPLVLDMLYSGHVQGCDFGSHHLFQIQSKAELGYAIQECVLLFTIPMPASDITNRLCSLLSRILPQELSQQQPLPTNPNKHGGSKQMLSLI